jgi:hypothetical protein
MEILIIYLKGENIFRESFLKLKHLIIKTKQNESSGNIDFGDGFFLVCKE